MKRKKNILQVLIKCYCYISFNTLSQNFCYWVYVDCQFYPFQIKSTTQRIVKREFFFSDANVQEGMLPIVNNNGPILLLHSFEAKSLNIKIIFDLFLLYL